MDKEMKNLRGSQQKCFNR